MAGGARGGCAGESAKCGRTPSRKTSCGVSTVGAASHPVGPAQGGPIDAAGTQYGQCAADGSEGPCGDGRSEGSAVAGANVPAPSEVQTAAATTSARPGVPLTACANAGTSAFSTIARHAIHAVSERLRFRRRWYIARIISIEAHASRSRRSCAAYSRASGSAMQRVTIGGRSPTCSARRRSRNAMSETVKRSKRRRCSTQVSSTKIST